MGSLHQTDATNREQGFLSFIRLVGTCYFKKHIAAFIANYEYSTPIQLYNSIDKSLPTEERHQGWLQKIRLVVSNRILNEEDRVPSYMSLWRHWLRSCVHQMWQQSVYPDMYSSLLLTEHNGWIKEGNRYLFDWEDKDVQEKVKSSIPFLTKGCSCKKGCTSNNCGCKEKLLYCGPGCKCQGCVNLPDIKEGCSSDDDWENDYSESCPESETDDNLRESVEMEIIADAFDTHNIL